jgi:hypothetical protein
MLARQRRPFCQQREATDMAQVLPSPPPGRHVTGLVKDHKVQTANIIEILIEGAAVGRCRSANFQQGFGTQPIHEIGSMMPAEHIPMQWTGRLTVDRYSLKAELIATLVGAFSEDILFKKLFDVVVRDRSTGVVTKTYQGCIQDSSGQNIAAGQPISENAVFFVSDVTPGPAGQQTGQTGAGAGLPGTVRG